MDFVAMEIEERNIPGAKRMFVVYIVIDVF